jgi:Helix-turn-helix domain
VGEDRTRGPSRPEDADRFGESGWVTTEVAARAVRVSPRTIRRYIDQGRLEAKPQGEGVRREWLISVDSLHALRASRTAEDDVPDTGRKGEYADSLADVLRDLAARLETRAEEAAELRVRLELTERTQSTLEDERRQAMQELEEERRRREEAERERDDLRQRLEAREDDPQSPPSPGPTPTPAPTGAEREMVTDMPMGPTPSEASEATQDSSERRSWWQRLFGG